MAASFGPSLPGGVDRAPDATDERDPVRADDHRSGEDQLGQGGQAFPPALLLALGRFAGGHGAELGADVVGVPV